MSVEVHRAGRAFYSHSTVLLNQPGRELTAFLGVPQWQGVAAAAFLEIPELGDRRLVEYGRSTAQGAASPGLTLNDTERSRLRSQGVSDEMIAQFEKMQRQLQSSRNQDEAAGSPRGLASIVVRKSGVAWEVWERAGQELLEAVLPLQSGNVTELYRDDVYDHDDLAQSRMAAQRLGLGSVTLATDFPITTATFGYSRVDYRPEMCRLNPFPPDPDHSGRFPVFVDVVQADAILLRLDHEAVLRWMRANDFAPSLPNGDDPVTCSKSYFVRLLDGVLLRQTIEQPEARLVFGLLHTLSHLAVRRAALLCGLDAQSLSEYVLPRTLTCALYCNHRFGATIGALSALFEQTLEQWLVEVRSSRRCVYDPVCGDSGGSCHACTHLAETSCRFFNLNLGRCFLYGGHDPILGQIRVGFLDTILAR